jgi:6-phosphofructo-2-kinase/fructose-2,6-biphosphatase 4
VIFFFLLIKYLTVFQSGESLIEHSYKADSDLSPSGWDYAERLRDFVLDHRAKALQERGFDPQERRLVVRPLHPNRLLLLSSLFHVT